MHSVAQPRLNNTDTAENTRPQHTDEKRRLFSAARQERWLNKKAVAKILPESRTARCCRYHLPGSRPAVLRDHSGHAFYAGLETCSSVWQCPICAAKISERRREELKNAFAVARGKGWFISMLTLTAPHYVHDELRKLMKSMCAAQNRLWKNNEHGLIRRFGILGRIRAFEVTHGENGFHPHFHIILFSTKELGQEFEDTVFPLWCKYCLKCGLNEPSREHGVKLQNAREAHNYMSKWGIEEEMTKSHIKKNKNKNGSSMFDLLRRFRGGDKLAGRLFAVYAEAFKGQHQLKWTKGLKVLLGIDDASDEEINTETREDAELFHRFSIEEWNAVTATDSEYNILFCVEHHPERFDEILQGIVKLWRIQYNEYRRLKRRQRVAT